MPADPIPSSQVFHRASPLTLLLFCDLTNDFSLGRSAGGRGSGIPAYNAARRPREPNFLRSSPKISFGEPMRNNPYPERMPTNWQRNSG